MEVADTRAHNGTPDLVLAEVRRILAAASIYHDEKPSDLFGAIARASADADERFIDRGDGVGPEPFAELLAHWISARVNEDDPAISLRRALRATEEDHEEDDLGGDLRLFISDYLDGSMSDERFLYLFDHPDEPLR